MLREAFAKAQSEQCHKHKVDSDSVESMAMVLLQTPKSIQNQLPEIRERQDIFKAKVGGKVFAELVAKRNHRATKRDTNNEKVCFLTAKCYLAHSAEPTKLSISTFTDVNVLQKAILASAMTGTPFSVNAILDIYNDTYQLRDVRLNPTPENTLCRDYGAYNGIPGHVLSRRMYEYIETREYLDAAVSKLLELLKVSDVEEFVTLSRRLNLTYVCPRSLIIDVHTSEPRAELAKSELEILATSVIVLNHEESDHRKSIQPIVLDLDVMAQAVKQLSFSPTKEQIKIALSVLLSFQGDVTTKHLIYGDVGYGKTCVIAMILYLCVCKNKNVVLLSPAEHLAIQTYDVISKWYPDLKGRISLVTHNTLEQVEGKPDGHCYIGTSALLFRDTLGFEPFLIAVDEEQRFGVSQRDYFHQQGAHYVAMTATPIPRTVAGTLLSHYQTHKLTKCFIQKSFSGELLMENSGRQRLFEQIKSCLVADKQMLIICPLTTDSESEQIADLKSVETLYESLTEYFGHKFRFVHSKRSSEENSQALKDVAQRKAKGLVASSIVEVGIDLPHLEVLVVFHPERFGLTQLHQLRGRIVRQGGHGWVTLYSPKHLNHEQIDRLTYFVGEQDGSKIAEYDAERRGVGDLIGETGAQSGAVQTTFIRHLNVDFSTLKSLIDKLN